MRTSLLTLSLACILSACGGGDSNDSPVPIVVGDKKEFSLTFDDVSDPWNVGFADYPSDNVDIYELGHSVGSLPEPLQTTRGLNIRGTNRSDDLFMFAERKLTGLAANQVYKADISLTFATNVASGCFGVGGSPGESVYIKAGVTEMQPKAEVGGASFYAMNIDKGNQLVSGKRVKTLGDFANSQRCDEPETPYELKTVVTEQPIELTATANGEAWAIVATDSGFESTTSIWFVSAKFTLTKQ